MFRRILMAAVLAGLIGGLGVSVLQEFTTTPLILQAETFETPRADEGANKPTPPVAQLSERAAHAHAARESTDIRNQVERAFYTTIANVLTGIGFALILVASIALHGQAVEGRKGVIWGAAGFAIVNLAPALGLPPEVPGTLSAELGARQSWWFLCVAATGAGLWIIVFRRGALWVLAGLSMMAVPHLFGAPQSEESGGAVPSELAAHFVAASLVTAAVFWCALGWLSAVFWMRFSDQ
ncbi:MAG: cobalt transporter [Alphaproteobacteria bacterium]|nr:cobalt transporter [Alphaproteobacteria bacterium]|tara:strand:- start:1138 stop:1851 length:714 start_codon:yes stop_codon:yes gene_type:complete